MNASAFRRAEAIENLESYSRIIVVHLALVTLFPENPAKDHWDAELNAFKKTLKRYDKAKKRDHNFTRQIIIETLGDECIDYDAKDAILIAVEGHGVKAPDNPDWNIINKAIESFADSIME